MTTLPLIGTRENRAARVRSPGPAPARTATRACPAGPAWALKLTLDRVAAALLLCVLAPLLAAIAVAVQLSSSGPVLFRQRRVSQGGREFTMFKFRTMAVADSQHPLLIAADLAPGGVEGEDRRTRVGVWLRRSALDELPQLINVLRGEMSLVGPRPERPEYVRLFTLTVAGYDTRHAVKPGMTGLAQVHGLRGPGPLAQRIALDHAYIENWSLLLDLSIALRTIKTLVLLEGR